MTRPAKLVPTLPAALLAVGAATTGLVVLAPVGLAEEVLSVERVTAPVGATIVTLARVEGAEVPVARGAVTTGPVPYGAVVLRASLLEAAVEVVQESVVVQESDHVPV